MKYLFQTIYETSYGTVKAQFIEKMTFEEAVTKGKKYCEDNQVTYVGTEQITA